MIVKRGDSYGVSVYDPALKRKRWVGTFATKAEARVAEREASRRRHVGGRLTCGEFAALWLDEYPRKAGATRRTYRYGLKVFGDEFARVRLSDLDRVTARGWALRHPQSNVRVVRAMFNDAINDGLHPGPNPFANLRLEQPRGRKDLIALTRGELDELTDKALEVHGEFGPVFRAMILFAGYVGLRPGEMFALERSDVGRDEVAIRRNLDGTGTLKLPKNDQERVVVLPPPAREALAGVPARIDLPWLFVTPGGRQFRKGIPPPPLAGRSLATSSGLRSCPSVGEPRRHVGRGLSSQALVDRRRRTSTPLVLWTDLAGSGHARASAEFSGRHARSIRAGRADPATLRRAGPVPRLPSGFAVCRSLSRRSVRSAA